MILILFLCIKLTILPLCVSSIGYECTLKDHSRNDPKIFLVKESPDKYFYEYQNQLNLIFIWHCNAYYDITIGLPEQPPFPENVIHFAVPDYYNGKPLENFVYAGNITKTEDVKCTKTNKTEPEFDCNEIVNLVSQSVKEINDGHLYDFVQGMDLILESKHDFMNTPEFKISSRGSCEPYYHKTSDLTFVLLCIRNHSDNKEKKVNIHPLTLIPVPDYLCHNYFNNKAVPPLYMNRLLSILAPEPFELPSEHSVPTIFYEAPYILSEEKAVFPNSMNLVPWRLLKYGFVKFLQAVGWQRVAIVTDDSEYSKDFEDELTALFGEERLVYTVIRCEESNCDMNKMVQELSRVRARIAVANVEEKNALYLIQHASRTIIWLLRDMAWDQARDMLNGQDAYSFSFQNTKTKECDVEDNILTGLNSIAEAYKYSKGDYHLKKPEFYRRFFDKVKHITPRITEAGIVVQRIWNSARVLSLSVNENGAKILNFDNPYKEGKPSDGTAHCLVSTYDYNNSCEDPLVMFLMFTLMMFVLTFLLITCFFDKTSPFNDIRYQNF